MHNLNKLFIYLLLSLLVSLPVFGQPFDFTGLSSPYCSDDGVVTLTGSAAPSGTFSGVGITDNGDGTAVFDPSMAGAGGSINYSLDAWQSIETGYIHSFGIQSDGSLWAWGNNVYSQLGNGSTTDSNIPIQIGSATWQSIVAGGGGHSLGIQSDGSLWAWGRNTFGQLGNGNIATSNIPIQIGSATWQSIVAGYVHSLGIQSDGSLWAWGRNNSGQLGNGNNNDSNIPIQIGTATNWQSIETGYVHSLGIQSNGTLWAWGRNLSGQLGNGSNTDSNIPIQIGTATNWQSVIAADNHSFGIQSDGTLWAWGRNVNGQLGNGSNTTSNIPIQIGSATWQSIAAGYVHSLGIQSDGSLWAWGNNGNGQLGNGNNTDSNIPIQISSATNWQSVIAAANHSLGIQSDGSLWAWGRNNYGQLGNGSTTDSNIPVQIGYYEESVIVNVCNGAIDISISDPCSCGNPLNVIDAAGTIVLFHETVSITAPAGQTWNLTLLNSGEALDINGVALALPAALTETPAGSGNYELEFYHSPDVGYNATFSNGVAADDQMIGNSCTFCSPIPTMSQWGLMILGLLFLTLSSLFSMQSEGVLNIKFVNTDASSVRHFINMSELPFNKSLYFRLLLLVCLCLWLMFSFAIQFFGYELTTADVPGSLIFAFILAYFLSLFFMLKEK
ncbi:MAG: RCC1 domain-containing protein [Chitinophagales bacterium]